MAYIILGQLTFWCEYGISQCFSRTSLIAACFSSQLWFDNGEGQLLPELTNGRSQSRVDAVFNSNLCYSIIDIGLPAKDRKQYLLVMTPGETVLLYPVYFRFGAPVFGFGTSDPG